MFSLSPTVQLVPSNGRQCMVANIHWLDCEAGPATSGLAGYIRVGRLHPRVGWLHPAWLYSYIRVGCTATSGLAVQLLPAWLYSYFRLGCTATSGLAVQLLPAWLLFSH